MQCNLKLLSIPFVGAILVELIYLMQFSGIPYSEIDISRIPTVLENMKMSGSVILRPVKYNQLIKL